MKLPLFLAALAALTPAADAMPAAVHSAIDRAGMDPAVPPCENFYDYANGAWLKATVIPPAYSRWGTFIELSERNQAELHGILEQAARDGAAHGEIERKVGDFYASGMDTAAIEAAGLAPLQPELDRIAAIRDRVGLQAEIARLHTLEINVGFGIYPGPDAKNSGMVIIGLGQAGLGLPDRDYYTRTDEKSAKLRAEYVAHVEKMLALSGEPPVAAQAGSAAVLKLETALALASKTTVELRDPEANYHKMSLAGLQKAAPGFDWTAYFAAVGLPRPGGIDVNQPAFMTGFARLCAETPLADWRAYLRWQFLNNMAACLSAEFVNEDFHFYGTILGGTPQLKERWKRVADMADSEIGELLGRLYVAEYFPPAAKTRALDLVSHIRAALRERLEHVAWMDAPTRAAAIRKLDALNVKVGYPDKWIDYRTLAIDRGPYVLNILRANTFDFHRQLAKVGKPVDPTEWGLTPPTVNAYYSPLHNEIVFPAGILQPPFFDAQADDALNYGAIGMIMGHEMTHGFDDQGRQYDPHGNLKNWWTPASAAQFKERAKAIIAQFDAYAVDGQHLNGELTQGENIADLGGVKIAYAALENALAGHPRAKIDGWTPEQRFFLSFAMMWRMKVRPETARLFLNTDPHSPEEFRVNGALSNLPEFAKAFGCPPDCPMVRPAKERVDIW